MNTNIEQLLLEAKEKYPIGCTVYSLGGAGNQLVTKDMKPYVDRQDQIRLSNDLMIYRDGKWAQITKPAPLVVISNYLLY